MGDKGVGKTSLLKQSASAPSFDDNESPTIGADFGVRTLPVNGKIVKLQMWEVGGNENTRESTGKAYCRGHVGFVLVYDVTSPESFQNLRDYWYPMIVENATYQAVLLIVGNKIDLTQSSTAAIVDEQEVKEFAHKIKANHITLS